MNRLDRVNRTYILELGIPARETDLNPYGLLTADEAFHTGNTICILPVRSIDGAPGPVTRQLTERWIEAVDCDWREKAICTLNCS